MFLFAVIVAHILFPWVLCQIFVRLFRTYLAQFVLLHYSLRALYCVLCIEPMLRRRKGLLDAFFEYIWRRSSLYVILSCLVVIEAVPLFLIVISIVSCDV